jgi:pimeloyl-ACP methyl ester carboxylesterase
MSINFLLLRGLAREARHWGSFPAILESRTGAKVFTLDLPGVGTEHRRESPRAILEIAGDLRRRWLPLREANPGPWAIMGISFGGMVAMCWIVQHSADFSRAIVGNTSAANLGLPHERLRPAGMAALFRAMREKDPLRRERVVLSVISNIPEDRRELVAAEWARYAEDKPIGASTTVRQLLAASSYPAPAQLPVPALVLASYGDRFVSASCSEKLARRLRVPLEMHSTAGHTLELDEPEWVAHRIRAWVRD